MRYSIETRANARGHTIYTLLDQQTGSSASVLPEVGFNLFDLKLPIAGAPRAIIATDPGWEDDPQRPTRQGIPILFPFPNRIRAGRFEWEGKPYELPLNKPPHAIHGFAVDAPWRDVKPLADDASASIAARFWLRRDAPQHLPHWPEDAVLLMRYELAGRQLTLKATVENPGRGVLPWGLGLHAYFHLPLEPEADPARTQIVIPASACWELDANLPTGRVLPVDPPRDYRAGQARKGLAADDVLTGLAADDDGWSTCRLIDQNLGGEIRLRCDSATREMVVFTPPANPRVVAVEPYSQTTDAINLASRGVDTGLGRLEPGRSTVICFRIETSG